MALEGTIRTYGAGGQNAGTIVQDYKALSNGNNTIVAAAAGQQTQVTAILISTDVAGVFTISSASEPIMKLNRANNSEYHDRSDNVESPVFCSEIGGDLVINVSSSPSNASVYIQYRRR
jgi:hypothetical protein